MSAGFPSIEKSFELAADLYARHGVDVHRALQRLAAVSVSLHCWQGDDVVGFEGLGEDIGGGLAVTGNYPGRARTPQELREDLQLVYSLLPGRHRLNLHASYGEFAGQAVDRDQITPNHFTGWIDWAREIGIGLDFNPTFFAHAKARDGFTLAHPDSAIRDFWIQHGIASREVAAEMGKQLGTPCVNNIWIPDGMKDTPVDRAGPRARLADALDRVFAPPFAADALIDAVECKLFGLGSEAYVVGSHEFYLGYAISRQKTLCLDAGHFHPTEVISDKISSVLQFVPRLLLHVSRGVRWDSDHVVVLTDEVQAICHELVTGQYLERTHIGLDFFDASINRIAAWVIGARNLLKGLLLAMLEPLDRLREFEHNGDYTSRLAWQEEARSLPWGAVWDYYCQTCDVPAGIEWLEEVQRYEREVLVQRG